MENLLTSTKTFKYVELFAGIKGFGKALDKLGGECLFTSEIDKYAQQAIKAMYPNENLHGDITKIDSEDIPSHDLLVGGMPCQAFSLAGKGLGFEDTRGTLFFEIARIAKHHQPKAILIENVKGLVSHDKGRTLDVMIHALNNIGYTIDFTILNSKFFGVPQNRERIFIVALRNDLITPEKWIIEGNNIVAKGKRRLLEQGVRAFNFDWPEQKEATTRLKDILEKVVDERYYLPNEKVAKLIEQLEGRTYKESIIMDTRQHIDERSGKGARIYEDIAPTLSATDYKEPKRVAEPQDNTGNSQVKKMGNVNPSGNGMDGCVYDVEAGLSPTLTTNKGQGIKFLHLDHADDEIDNVHSCSTRTRAYAGKPEALEIRKDEVSNTITSVAKDAYVFETPKYRIRKLTPLETWRLQSFSDEDFFIVKNAGVSDTQLYKQSGNAVTVKTVEAVGEKLMKYIRHK